MEELRTGEGKAGFARLLDLHIVAIDMCQSKKDDLGKIALHARLFCYCFTQFNREAQCHSGAVFGPTLPLAVDLPSLLLDCQSLPFRDCAPIHSLSSWASKAP